MSPRSPRGGAAGTPAAPIVGAAAASLLVGCLTTASLFDARGTGLARCYRLSYDSLWAVTEASVRWVGLVIENQSPSEGFFLARSYEPEVQDPEDMALDADQGERVAVFLEREGPDVWALEIVSKPIFALDVSRREWELPLFEAIESRLPASATEPDEDLAACTRVRALRGP